MYILYVNARSHASIITNKIVDNFIFYQKLLRTY